jgi:hypothetical protein
VPSPKNVVVPGVNDPDRIFITPPSDTFVVVTLLDYPL